MNYNEASEFGFDNWEAFRHAWEAIADRTGRSTAELWRQYFSSFSNVDALQGAGPATIAEILIEDVLAVWEDEHAEEAGTEGQ